jgi:hypothetical protein
MTVRYRREALAQFGALSFLCPHSPFGKLPAVLFNILLKGGFFN